MTVRVVQVLPVMPFVLTADAHLCAWLGLCLEGHTRPGKPRSRLRVLKQRDAPYRYALHPMESFAPTFLVEVPPWP